MHAALHFAQFLQVVQLFPADCVINSQALLPCVYVRFHGQHKYASPKQLNISNRVTLAEGV